MTDDTPDWPTDDPDDDSIPIHGQVTHSNQSARVPTGVGAGHFSNGTIILGGRAECIFDFLLRIGELQKVVARVILPRHVALQFRDALTENLNNYRRFFGSVPRLPRPVERSAPAAPVDDETADPEEVETSEAPERGTGSGLHEGIAAMGSNPRQHDETTTPSIDDIYLDLKFPDELLAGKYANAVLIRHTNTEFCFDFITSAYPRSAVSCRVFMATPQVPPLLDSLIRSLAAPPQSGSEST